MLEEAMKEAIKQTFLSFSFGDFQRKMDSETVKLLFKQLPVGILNYANLNIDKNTYKWRFDAVAVSKELDEESLTKIKEVEEGPHFFGWIVRINN